MLLEKKVLKDYLPYAKIIADKYENLPTYDETTIKHWIALNHSNCLLWKRFISKLNVIFVSSEITNQNKSLEILNKNFQILYQENQPYSSQPEMKEDLMKNNRLYISIDYSTHPYFNLIDNIVFRTVHDYITHILGEFQFGLTGELSCYNLHAKLATKETVPALFTEVR